MGLPHSPRGLRQCLGDPCDCEVVWEARCSLLGVQGPQFRMCELLVVNVIIPAVRARVKHTNKSLCH